MLSSLRRCAVTLTQVHTLKVKFTEEISQSTYARVCAITFLYTEALVWGGNSGPLEACLFKNIIPVIISISICTLQVAGRILDRRYDLYGKDINTGVKLDSDVYNPVYEERTEFRETNIPPTATLLLKVWSMTTVNLRKQMVQLYQ